MISAKFITAFGVILHTLLVQADISAGECSELKQVYVQKGESVKFKCRIFAGNTSDIEWLLIDNYIAEKIPVAQDDPYNRFSVLKDGNLFILLATSTDAGVYICMRQKRRACSAVNLTVHDCKPTPFGHTTVNPCNHGVCREAAYLDPITCVCLPQYTGKFCDIGKQTLRGLIFAAPFLIILGIGLFGYLVFLASKGSSKRVKAFNKGR